MFRSDLLLVRTLLIAAAATTTACGDSTAPGAQVDVAVSVAQIVGPNIDQAPDDGNRVACEVTLHARATGNGRASWGDATFRWYAGKDRSTPFDSSVASAIDVRRAWADSSITAGGGLQTARWNIWANVPFSGGIDFHYRVGTRERTTSLKFDCGPPIVAGAEPPSFSDISAQSLAAELEPSGVLNVAYTVSSPVGVWRTAVLVSGPCEVTHEFDEPLARSVTRAVAISLPADCALGVPVYVTVFATDATLDRRARQITTPYVLVDRTRPWIRGTVAARPAGPFFVGDTIDFAVNTGDNNVVRSITWEARPFGARDSIETPPRGGDAKVRIPVQAGWAGQAELRYFARDAVGLVSDTIVSAAGSVAVYPTVDRPTGVVDLGDDTWSTDEAVDVTRGVVYLMDPLRRQIVVASLASRTVVSTIPLSLYPATIDLTPGGDSLLVALPEVGALGIIDLTRTVRRLELMPLDSIPGYGTVKPSSVSEVRALANGKAYVVVNVDPGGRRLVEFDLATGAQRPRYDAGTGSAVGGSTVEGLLLTRSPNGAVMTVRTGDCVQRFDSTTDQFGPCTRTQTSGVVSAADAAGQRFAIGPDVYDASWRHLSRTELLPAGSGFGSVLTLDGRDVYLPYAGALVRASATDGRILNRQLPAMRVGRVRLSPDGTFVLAVGTSVATGNPAIGVIDIR